MKKRILEIACFDFESAIRAQEAGADRIEFCKDYLVGGISPDINEIVLLRKNVSIPLHIIVRPRSGNFLYSKKEFSDMCTFAEACIDAGADGLVLGFLNSEDQIEKKQAKEFLNLCKDVPLTFHRAIDVCLDLSEAIKTLIDLGYSSVLTSGGARTALIGLSQLKSLQNEFGKLITLIPGGGIRSNNISEIMKSECAVYHSAAIARDGKTADVEEIKKLKTSIESYA